MLVKGHITDEQMEQLKAAYPETPLFLLELTSEDDIVFRTMTKEDVVHLRDTYEMLLQEKVSPSNPFEHRTKELICDLCVVWPAFTPEMKEDFPLGYIPTIAEMIEMKSGYLGVTVDGFIRSPNMKVRKVHSGTPWPRLDDETIKDLVQGSKYPLWKIEIEGMTVVIRPQTQADLFVAAQAIDDQLAMVQQITVWPYDLDWNLVPTGYIDIIGHQSNTVSGMADTEGLKVTQL